MKYKDLVLRLMGADVVINTPEPCRYNDVCKNYNLKKRECQEYEGRKWDCYNPQEDKV